MRITEYWYIQILDGPRGAVLATVRPSDFRFNKTMNQKQGFTARIPWDDDFELDNYVYLRHDSSPSDIWFYGRIDDVSRAYESAQGQHVQISGYCNIEQLSGINVKKLALYDFGIRTPAVVKRVNTTPSDPDDYIDQNEPLLYDGSTAQVFEWRQTAADGHSVIDTLMVGSYVPFKGIYFDIDPGFTEAWAGGDGGIHLEILGGDGSWDFVENLVDGTANLNQSGSITFSDPSGGWIKHQQSGDYLFFCRIWFFLASGTKDRNIGINEITIDQRIETATAIGKTMALTSGWTASNTTTDVPVYHQCEGESVTAVFGLLSRMTGGYWYNASTGSSNIIGWEESGDANLVAKESAPYTFSNANNNITSLTGKDVATAATRLTLYGNGNGQNRLTAIMQDGTVTLPAGFTYSSGTNELVNTTAETTLGREIHKQVTFPWVSSLFASGESIEAANQLLRMGVKLLEKASRTDREAYTVKVLGLTEDIPVGACVRLNYSKGVKTVDKAFIVTSVNATYSASSPKTEFVFTLSDDGFLIDSKTGQISLEMADSKDEERYTQTISNVDVEGSIGGGGGSTSDGDNLGDHTATENLQMGGFDITGVGDVDGVDVSALETSVNSHVANTSNPHSVTRAQIGAAADSDLTSHTSNTSNPHSVTAAQVGAVVQADIDSAISNLIDSSPGTLDTLNELAAALGDDPNFSATITALIATKAAQTLVDNLVTLTGRAANSTHLGTFSGSTLSDNEVLDTLLQELETAVEAAENQDTTSNHNLNPGLVSESTVNGDMGFRRAFLGSATSADAPLTIWAESASGTRELFRGKTSAGASKIITRIASHGGLNQYMYNDAGTLQIFIDCDTALNIELVGLPTTNPGGTGKIWNDGGTLKIT